jgi:hypothetical protein
MTGDEQDSGGSAVVAAAAAAVKKDTGSQQSRGCVGTVIVQNMISLGSAGRSAVELGWGVEEEDGPDSSVETH